MKKIIIIGLTLGLFIGLSSAFLYFRPYSGSKILGESIKTAETSTPTKKPTPTTTNIPTLNPTIKSTIAPIVTYDEPLPTFTPIPTKFPLPTQTIKMDSATQIELCKTKADTFKTQTMTALVLVYNQTNPAIVELGNASTIYETKIVAIKYGMIKEGDLESNFTVVSNYLTNTHDWALKQISDYMATVNGKGSLAYNDYYTKCLNGEN